MSKMWIPLHDYRGTGSKIKAERIEDKGKVLSFLKSFEPKAAAAGHFNDEVTGEAVDVDWLSYSSGTFSWTTADIYHFEKYNLKLKPEFVEYAIAHSA